MVQDHSHQESPNAKTGNERQKKSEKKARSRMDIVAGLIGIAVTAFAIAAAVFFSVGHRDAGLWASCIAIALAVIGATCLYQDSLWRKDASKQIAQQPSRHAHVLFTEIRLVLPEKDSDPIRVTFGLMNTGDADAVFTIKDRTYYYTEDPNQTVFEYQRSPAEEVTLSAGVPTGVWRAEMRFDFRLTPEKLDALKSGKARLFFYARTEYRDSTGTYPLQL